MADFKEALHCLDPEMMHGVVTNLGSRIHSQDDDPITNLSEYPAFDSLIVGLASRIENNPLLSQGERQSIMLGAMICLEAFVDYANAEDLKARITDVE